MQATTTPAAIRGWHAIVDTRNPAALEDLIAPDAVFLSPVVHAPQVGKAVTVMYLTAAAHVLINDSWKYTNEWIGEHSGVLEFEVTIDGILINGVDIIEWNDAGKITRFKVMVRPLKAINLLHRMMGEMLGRLGAAKK